MADKTTTNTDIRTPFVDLEVRHKQRRLRRKSPVKQACLQCRTKHLACDKQRPCTQCTKKCVQCIDDKTEKEFHMWIPPEERQGKRKREFLQQSEFQLSPKRRKFHGDTREVQEIQKLPEQSNHSQLIEEPQIQYYYEYYDYYYYDDNDDENNDNNNNNNNNNNDNNSNKK